MDNYMDMQVHMRMENKEKTLFFFILLLFRMDFLQDNQKYIRRFFYGGLSRVFIENGSIKSRD